MRPIAAPGVEGHRAGMIRGSSTDRSSSFFLLLFFARSLVQPPPPPPPSASSTARIAAPLPSAASHPPHPSSDPARFTTPRPAPPGPVFAARADGISHSAALTHGEGWRPEFAQIGCRTVKAQWLALRHCDIYY